MSQHVPGQMELDLLVEMPREQDAYVEQDTQQPRWTLPPFGSIDVCPRCAMKTERKGGIAEYHGALVLSQPCGRYYGLDGWQDFPEHLCRRCGRCGAGWVEGVAHGS